MKKQSDRDNLERIKSAVTCADVCERLGMRKKYRRYDCPICQRSGGKTPDLSVKGTVWHCFKCGESGDVFKLVMLTQNLDFSGAVKWLEDAAGIRRRDREKGGYPGGAEPRKTQPGPTSSGFPGTGEAGRAETPAAPDPAVYAAFLSGCRPVTGRPLEWLTKVRGISPKVVKACRLRFCGQEYPDLMDTLKTRFSDDALTAAGLLKRSTSSGRLVPSFWHYYGKKVGFVVIPYLQGDRPVYLKVRPPCEKEKAERLGVARFMNTAAAVPCLYNVDVLTAQPRPDKVLICEGESDTWTALSHGYAAVGSPGAKAFKPEWIGLFEGFVTASGKSTVILVPDADVAGAAGSRTIAGLFRNAGLPVPLRITIPSGKDLSGYMREGMTA